MQSSASRLTTDGRKSKKLQDDEVSHNNEENSGFSTTNGSGIISLKSKGAKNLAPLMNKQFARVSDSDNTQGADSINPAQEKSAMKTQP